MLCVVYVDYYWIKRRYLVEGIISNIYDYYLCKLYKTLEIFNRFGSIETEYLGKYLINIIDILVILSCFSSLEINICSVAMIFVIKHILNIMTLLYGFKSVNIQGNI